MPKRGDLVVLEALCTGAMEGLNSGSKYFVEVGESRIVVTPDDILDMEDLICLVSSHLGCYQPANLKSVYDLLIHTLDWIYEKADEYDPSELWTHGGKVHVIFERDEKDLDIEAFDGKYGLQEGQ